MKKQYLIFVNDHSCSMQNSNNHKAALKDFNETVASIKIASEENNIDTIVSIVRCGVDRRTSNNKGFTYDIQFENNSLKSLKPMVAYIADGGDTPLLDSVALAIKIAERVPDYNDPDVSFLIQTTTDGGENSSRIGRTEFAKLIKDKINTDKFSFIFRVPKGDKGYIASQGVPMGNITEWDTTAKDGMEKSTAQTKTAYSNFYASRSAGATSTSRFYADMSNVDVSQVKAELQEVTNNVRVFTVRGNEADMQIRDFIESRISDKMKKGGAFYQLIKSEDKVQANKLIIIRDKSNSKYFCGDGAREMMGIPIGADIKLSPGNLGNFDVFIQSTSVNRKVKTGSAVIYWDSVGVNFKEGPSA